MQDLLRDMVATGDPNLIQKYVEKYLPSNDQNLQRIYSELNKYQSPKKQTKPIKNSQSQPKLVSKLNRPKKNIILKSTTETAILRSKSLMNHLRQKGIQSNEELFEIGLEVSLKEIEKVLKPLQPHPQSNFFKKSKINELCAKYDINKQFYQNPPAGFTTHIAGFNPEMLQFIQRRNSLLKAIQAKKYDNLDAGSNKFKVRPRKYSSVQSKLLKINRPYQSINGFQMLKLNSRQLQTKKDWKKGTQKILQRCDHFQKTGDQFKQTGNFYEKLQEKLQEYDQQTINIQQALKVRISQNVYKEGLQRYNHSYMNYLRQNVSYSKLDYYRRDLIKDEKKMRQKLVNQKNY